MKIFHGKIIKKIDGESGIWQLVIFLFIVLSVVLVIYDML